MDWDDERIAERKNEERKWGGEMESIKWKKKKRELKFYMKIKNKTKRCKR